MALKFRRGTTAQKSGSLAIGEPYINYDLQTLQIGTDQGDVTLSTTSPTATSAVASISASNFVSSSYLHVVNDANIKGNVTIGGTIQIGDQSSDTINVVASLSSSLIPQADNTYDLGSLTKVWRDLYISTGSIKMVSNGTVVSVLSNTANGFTLDQGVIANGNSSFGTSSAAVTSITGSLKVSGSLSVVGASRFDRDILIGSSANDSEKITVGFGPGTFASHQGSNLAVGPQNLASLTPNYNTQVGVYNTAVGYSNLLSVSTGSFNTTLGGDAGAGAAAGVEHTTLVGYSAGKFIAGGYHTLLGSKAGQTLNNGTANIGIGYNTLSTNRLNASSGYNIVMGIESGNNLDGSSNNNIIIGNYSGPQSVIDESNKLYIGHQGWPLITGSLEQGNLSLNINGATYVSGALSASTLTGIGNVSAYSYSVDLRLKSSGTDLTALSSSIYQTDATQSNNITTAQNSANGAFASASAYSASAAVVAQTNANSAAGAFASASAYSSSAATSFSASLASQTALSASIASTDSVQSNNISTVSASAWGAFQSASSYSASAATALNSYSSSAATTDSASKAQYTSFSASAATTYAQLNVANTFNANQIVSGSLTITGNVTIQGSSSLQNITASAVSIGTNTVLLNTNNPAIRYGGISVIDSGSSASTGSLLWDSTNNVWIYTNPSGSTYVSARLISGPQSQTQGSEPGLTNGTLPVAVGDDHIGDSIVTQTGGNTINVAGAVSASTFTGLGNLSSYSTSVDSRIVTNTNSAAGAYASASAYSASAAIVAQTNANSAAGAYASASAYSSSAATSFSASLANVTAISSSFAANTITINGVAVALGGTLTQAQTINGAISTSAQVDHNSTTNYDANKHVDHTTVSITAGSGMSGGGTIAASRTLTLDTSSAHFVSGARAGLSVVDTTGASGIDLTYNAGLGTLSGVLANSSVTINGSSVSLGGSLTTAQVLAGAISSSAQVSGLSILYNSMSIAGTSTALGGTISAATIGNAIGAFSSSAQIDHNSTTNYVANKHIDHTSVSITAGSGLSGGGDISSTRTLTLDTGSAHFISGTRGTISNGTGVSYSAGVISIGQAVATTSAVTFASVTATGDIVAYSTSDKRHKNNIQPITDALAKVTKLNGVTWEWNDDVDDVTKQTPKTGLIAQEVQEVLPEVVKEREDGFLALDYSKTIGLLVEAIKEQQQQIHSLTLEIQNLKKNNSI